MLEIEPPEDTRIATRAAAGGGVEAEATPIDLFYISTPALTTTQLHITERTATHAHFDAHLGDHRPTSMELRLRRHCASATKPDPH